MSHSPDTTCQFNVKFPDDTLINIYGTNVVHAVDELSQLAALAPDVKGFIAAIRSAQPGMHSQQAAPAQQQPAYAAATTNQVAYSDPNTGQPQWSTPQPGPAGPSNHSYAGVVVLDDKGNPLPAWAKPCHHASPTNPMNFVTGAKNNVPWSAIGCPAPRDATDKCGLQFKPK